MGEKEFTHLTETGVHMVEVGAKPQQRRTAVASGKIHLQKETIEMIKNAEIKKGNVLTTAQIAGIQAVKKTGQTGVEMEAITGVSVALLTIWDMTKAVEKDENGQYPDTKISDIVVLKKEKL